MSSEILYTMEIHIAVLFFFLFFFFSFFKCSCTYAPILGNTKPSLQRSC